MFFKLVYIVSIFTSGIFLTGICPSEPARNEHLLKGDTYYRSFDNDMALKEYQIAYTEAPTDYAPLLRLVRLQNDLGRIHLHDGVHSEEHYRIALAYADSLQRYYPDSAAAHFMYALAKGSLIPFVGVREKISIGKEVKQHLQETLRRDSTFSNAYVLKAIFERQGSQLSWFEKGIVRLVFGEDLSGSLETSKDYLHRALAFDSTNSFAYYELFWTYKALDDTASARSALEHLLTMTPRNLREQNQQEEAQHDLAKLLGTEKTN
jgi:tetratricopeptide (TPR) repeat protein